jgi:HEAT repeat protein
VQVLAAAIRLGLAVEAPLIAALSSSKAYVRQGAALALGRLRSDDGVAAVANLLLTEPTEIWKEVARALGQVGPQALHHLARTVRDEGSTVFVEERVAWAIAHLGARDCHKAIVQMSSGHSIMAPIAARALLLVDLAARDQQALVSDSATGEITVNRAFSRQFFFVATGALIEGTAPDKGSQVLTLDDNARGQRREASESDS